MVIKLRDDSGTGIWIDEHKAIAEKFTSDYTKRFKSAHSSQRTLPNIGIAKLILDHENSKLIRLPNLEEVKEVVFSIVSNKTPRSDGLGLGFFKNYLDIIEKDLFNCILEFFTTGKILK